jgi:diaminohydroxyphosphoribosylaminopyrimidine deaminase/5-amino-6-(5-phosphoribosylamino)uracil reductase
MVEGGQALSSALIREGLVDKIGVFVSPFLLGGGTRSILGLGIDRLSERLDIRRQEWTTYGKDVLLTGYF